MPVRTSEAVWRDGVRDGDGTISLGSGAWEGSYSFRSRFTEDEPKRTNPEELLAAGHAGCFSLALANNLEREAHPPKEIQTEAACHLEMDESAGPTITRIEFTTEVEIDDIDSDLFEQLVTESKENCPVSRALEGVELTADATLVD